MKPKTKGILFLIVLVVLCIIGTTSIVAPEPTQTTNVQGVDIKYIDLDNHIIMAPDEFKRLITLASE